MDKKIFIGFMSFSIALLITLLGVFIYQEVTTRNNNQQPAAAETQAPASTVETEETLTATQETTNEAQTTEYFIPSGMTSDELLYGTEMEEPSSASRTESEATAAPSPEGSAQPSPAETAASESTDTANTLPTYVLNSSTLTFHTEDCSHVADIKDENKIVTQQLRQELMLNSYVPCEDCNP